MIKLSRLLGHERVTCVAHCSHNLLITDTLTKIPEAQALIYQCKDIVSALHFKAQEFALEQKEAYMYAKIQNLQDEIDADSNDPIDEISAEDEDWQLGTKKSKPQTHKK